MAGMLKGREALVLAATLWTALSINDILMLPGGLSIITPGWLGCILLALVLARTFQRLQSLPRGRAIAFGPLDVVAAATIQAAFDVAILLEARREGERLVLSVENDPPDEQGIRKPAGMGIGLRNVTERLQARFGSRWHFSSGPVDGGRYRAAITLSLRKA